MDIKTERALIRKSQKGDKDATMTLINQFDDMIAGIANSTSAKCEFSDLKQHGYVAFIESIQSFNLKLDPPVRLMTWAYKCVRQKMYRWAREETIIHVPRRDTDAVHLIPFIKTALSCRSYDAKLPLCPNGYGHLLADKSTVDAIDAADKNERIEILRAAIASLPRNEKIAVNRRLKGFSFEEIGIILGGVTRQRAQQLEAAGKEKIEAWILDFLANKRKISKPRLDIKKKSVKIDTDARVCRLALA